MSNLLAKLKKEPSKESKRIISFIQEYIDKLDREGIVIGISGGIDSALAAKLCSKAIEKEKVLGLLMPEKEGDKKQFKMAKNLVEELGIESKIIEISPYLKEMNIYQTSPFQKLPFKKQALKSAFKFHTKVTGRTAFETGIKGLKGKKFASYIQKSNAYYRVKHRLRALFLYYHAELQNKLVVGAANKTEEMIGFFVKHGCDSSADIMPLQHLYKTQVRELAEFLNIPEEIRKTKPTPDLLPGIDDEEAIGLNYENLDKILVGLEKELKVSEISEITDIKKEKIEMVKRLIKDSEHKKKVYSIKK